VDTAPVARDIVEIFERHGEWREHEARRLLALTTSMPTADRDTVLERSLYRKGAERIQYWGFSYGTVLGATLSAMYPDRIERAVLDGVADSHDYMAAGWGTNLRDTDMLILKMAEYCFEGGASNCAIWHEDGPALIVGNIQKAFLTLQNNPIGVPGNKTHGPEIVTQSDLLNVFGQIVYHPLIYLPKTAEVLAELLDGKGDALAAWKKEQRPKNIGEPLSEQCRIDGSYSPACHTVSGEAIMQWDATYAIACSDGSSRRHETKEEFREYANKLIAQSQLFGGIWASIMLPCTAWHARPHWRYEGDFHNKTAHPILFIGNTFDPVTPLYNAFVMVKGFGDAGILQQDSEGHCTYASVSMCSGRALRDYFQFGTLPGKKGGLEDYEGYGAVCEQNRQPFDGYNKGTIPGIPKGETDTELWQALVGLNQNWP
jgi:pimeloyl-ACP methyl ester carboxylesterase